MAVRVVCPGCQTALGIPESQAHLTFRCPKCQGLIPPAQAAAVAVSPTASAPPTIPPKVPAPTPPPPPSPLPPPVSTVPPLAKPVPAVPAAVPSKPAPPSPARPDVPILELELVDDPPKEAPLPALEVVAPRGKAAIPEAKPVTKPVAASVPEAIPVLEEESPFAEAIPVASVGSRSREDRPTGYKRRPKVQPKNPTIWLVLGLILTFVGCSGLVIFPVFLISWGGDETLPPPDVVQQQPGEATTHLALPPVPQALPIEAGVVRAETSVPLPHPVDGVTVAGGGRFLLLHFRNQQKLGLFDANEAKVVGYVPLAETGVRVAGGMDKFVVFYPNRGMLERFDLLTRNREQEAPLAVVGELHSVCMGAHGHGPVLVSSQNSFHLVDLDTLRPLKLPKIEGTPSLDGKRYWSGGSGRIFGATNAGGGQPSGIATLVLGRDKLRWRYEHDSAWFIIPGPDDKNIFVGGHGLRLADLSRSPDGEGFPESRGNVATTYLPAHHDPFFMQVHVGFRVGNKFKANDPDVGVTVYLLGNQTPLLQLGNVGVVPYENINALGGLGYPGSVHLLPRANLLVVVPAGRDRLLLHPVDLGAALKKTGIPYQYVTSSPPPMFQPGRAWVYQVGVQTQAAQWTAQLVSGPAGMKVSPEGLVEWQPPNNINDDRVQVTVGITADGRQSFHAFELTKEGAK